MAKSEDSSSYQVIEPLNDPLNKIDAFNDRSTMCRSHSSY